MNPTKTHNRFLFGEEESHHTDEKPELSRDDVLNLHKQLMQQARRKCPEQHITDASKRCSCHRIDSRVQRPFGNKHLPGSVGDAVLADVFYPVQKNRSLRAVLFCESMTRFRDGSLLKDVSHPTLASAFLTHWISWVGPPKKLLVDNGSHFVGRQWSILSNVFGVAIIVVPVKSHHSVGKVERLIQTLVHAFTSIDESVGDETDNAVKMAMAFMAHNTTPSSGSSIPPIIALTGRPSIISSLRNASVADPSIQGAYGNDGFFISEENARSSSGSERDYFVWRQAYDFHLSQPKIAVRFPFIIRRR